jgi:hypothetical protein
MSQIDYNGIKHLYINLPKQGIFQSTAIWLDINMIYSMIREQILQLLTTIIEKNYYQYNNQYFKPMGSPITGTLAEMYIKSIEERYLNYWIEKRI